MRIGFASSDWSKIAGPDGRPSPGGSTWYRADQPARWLERMTDWDVVHGPTVAVKPGGEVAIMDHAGELHDGLDVVVVNRWMHPKAAETYRGARALGQAIVVDVDDWFFGLSSSNLAWRATHESNAKANRTAYRHSLAAATMLTVSTPYLAERLARLNDDIVVVRNAIDLSGVLAGWATIPAREDRPDWGPPGVGWVGATSWRSHDLEQLRGVLGPWCQRHGWRFHHSGAMEGAPEATDLLGLPEDVPVTRQPMAPIHEYPLLWCALDVGVVPLNDVPFNEAKSAIKGMEAAAAGVPFVASASPEYRWLRDEHGIGRVAKRPRDWLRHLDALEDPETRQVEAAVNRDQLAKLDMEARWGEWQAAYLHALTLG